MTATTLIRPEPRPEILAIEAYGLGKSSVAGVAKIHKLSSNESPLGPSQKANEASRASARGLAQYPDVSATALREAIGRRLGLEPSRIICGNVTDAAYAEYVTRNDYASGLELAATSENVVVTRTFSKIHGLANLRIGWAFGPKHVLDALNRVRGPFHLNGQAIAIGAASLADTAHIEAAIEHNKRWLRWPAASISALGVEVTPSVGNFLLFGFNDAAAGRSAASADVFLSAHDFILRSVRAYGLPKLSASDGWERRGQPRRRRRVGRVHTCRTWLSE